MTRLRHVVSSTIGGALWSVSLLLCGCATTQDTQEDEGFYYDEVEIGAVRDFDEPLSPYGEWVEVESYGRCWRPSRVGRDWRPYSDGSWVRTDAGWYWESDEPWAWATYHYGRWDYQGGLGWYWVPHTRWAPAWVSWRSGGGYVGWAPLPPSPRFEVDVVIRDGDPRERGYVFVQERRFAERVRPTTVIVNNTTIVRQTVNITNIKVVNNTVINEGPRVEVVEQASGRKVRRAQVAELRRAQEAQVVVQHPAIAPRRRASQGNPSPVNPATESGRASRQERTRNNARESDRRANTAPARNADQPPPAPAAPAVVVNEPPTEVPNAQSRRRNQRESERRSQDALERRAAETAPPPPVVVVNEPPTNTPNERNANRDERNANRDKRNANRDRREAERRATNAPERAPDEPPPPPAVPAVVVEEPPNDPPNERNVNRD